MAQEPSKNIKRGEKVANIPPLTHATQTTTSKPVPALFFTVTDSISRKHLETVKEVLKSSTNDSIYLVVKSFGGDVYSAVRIIKHLRHLYPKVVGVLPNFAYSAASLMLFGTDKILVSPDGNIGPIDIPLEHQSGESISSLDLTNAITTLAGLVSSQALTFYEKIRGSKSGMTDTISKQIALETSWKAAVDLITPLTNQIDPILLQKSYRDLKIGIYYGTDLLNLGMVKGYTKAKNTAEYFATSFPSHNFAIFREDMRIFGLTVENLENSQDEKKLIELYNNNSGIKFVKDIYE
ncbi:MAG TPA: ATP-dependent Clp protease proteolytic subunit [Candidatus Saccharimonadales bacterium]|nr:ATP-dependent Clp protease proteolytic subunit [Candidatus Saccharimonadales bacterium]